VSLEAQALRSVAMREAGSKRDASRLTRGSSRAYPVNTHTHHL
jgi:hypothetical protein